MTEMLGSQAFERAVPATAPTASLDDGIGVVSEISGSSSQVILDSAALEVAARHSDPIAASAGQVGSQVKVRVGAAWLIANIRSLKLIEGSDDQIVAQVDFLCDGDEEKLTGQLYQLRRGVT